MKRIVISSTEELLLLSEEEYSYNLKECQELFNWYYDNKMILYSKCELIRMMKDHLKNEEMGNILDYLVNPN